MVTDKQRGILLKNNFTNQAINSMSYEEVSKTIGDILSQPKERVTSDRKWPQNGSYEQKKAKEYHLTPEAVKIAALNATLETLKQSPEEKDNFWKLVKSYEDYINGK